MSKKEVYNTLKDAALFVSFAVNVVLGLALVKIFWF